MPVWESQTEVCATNENEDETVPYMQSSLRRRQPAILSRRRDGVSQYTFGDAGAADPRNGVAA